MYNFNFQKRYQNYNFYFFLQRSMNSQTQSISPLENLVLFKYAKTKIIYQSKIKTLWLVKAYGTNERYIIKQHKPRKDQDNNYNEEINNLFNENMDVIPIFNEAKILFIMQGTQGFPFIYWGGNQEDKQFIIIQQLGQSLQVLRKACGGAFSLKTICMLGLQMMKIMKYLHKKRYFLGQVKQKAFSFGKGKKSHLLYVNDFSSCTKIPNISEATSDNTKDSEEWQQDKTEPKKFQPDLLDLYKILKLLQQIYQQSADKNKNFKAPQLEVMVKECFRIAKNNSNVLQQNIHQRFIGYFNSIMFRYHWKNDYVFDWHCYTHCSKYLKFERKELNLTTQKDNEIVKRIFFPYQENVEVDLLQQYQKKSGTALQQMLTLKNNQLTKKLKVRGKQKQDCVLI